MRHIQWVKMLSANESATGNFGGFVGEGDNEFVFGVRDEWPVNVEIDRGIGI